jgi:hypothetical protein
MRKLIAVVLAGGLLFGILGAPASAKPLKVMTDVAGDAGNQDSGIPGFDQMGFDLVGASIDKKGSNLLFSVEHAAMPPVGAMPEGARFMWHFVVDGKGLYRWTVKSFDIGKPDAVAGSGTERVGQVYANGVARLEECSEEAGVALTLVNCNTIAYEDVVFDPATKTFTITAPLKDMKAKAGSTIAGGTHAAGATSCMLCWVPHYAERSLTATTVIDSAAQAVTYKVPR